MSGGRSSEPAGTTRPAARAPVVTTKDVAARAGVGAGTVSNVLNNPHLVSAVTRRRVEDAITELGFSPDESARSLRLGRSRTVALVVPDIANPFFDDVATGADDAADRFDAMVLVSSSSNSVDRELRHLRRLSTLRLRGLMITPMVEPPWDLLQDIQSRGTPVVLIDHVPPPERQAANPVAAVTVDDRRGGFLVGEHLLQLGHRRITYLAPVFQQTRARLAGLREAVGPRTGIEVERCDAMTIAAGARAAADLLDRTDAIRPGAVFCGNDLIAIGVLGELHQRGLRVPEDVAVVGYDDIDLSASSGVALTTVRQPRHELGAQALELLLTPSGGEPLSVFRPELVVRDSTLPSHPPTGPGT